MAQPKAAIPDDEKPARPRAKRQAPMVRRQDLLAVTVNCLARLGPKGTTGREICRQAGVSHGLLRHYFKNPGNLLYETYEELCDHFIERFERALGDGTDDPWRGVEALFAVLFSEDWVNSDLLGAWIAFWTMVRTDEAFAAKSEDYNARFGALLGKALARIPRRSDSLPMIDVVPIVSSVMDGLWLDFCLSPSRTSRDRAMELCMATVRQLLQPKQQG